MASAPRYAMTRRELEVPELDRDGPLTLAAALCYVAAAQHSKDAQEQQGLAAAFYNDCVSDFAGVNINANVEALLCQIIKGQKR